MKIIYPLLAGMLMSTAAVAQTPDFRGTVNAVTDSQISRAKAAITHAGYQPSIFQFAQDGNLFFTATKAGDTYGITVTPTEQVYAGVGLPEHAPS